MKIALLGCGYWGSVVAKNLKRQSRLGSVFDINTERAKELSQEYHVPIMGVVDNPLKYAYIAIPHGEREPLIFDAVRKYEKIIIEKPAHDQLEELNALYALADKHNSQLYIAHLMRYSKQTKVVKTFVERVGASRVAEIQCTRASKKREYLQQDIVLDFAVHDLSIVQEILGPVSVHCDAGSISTSTKGQRDSSILFHHRNGCRVTIDSLDDGNSTLRLQKFILDQGVIEFDEVVGDFSTDFSCAKLLRIWQEVLTEYNTHLQIDALTAMINSIVTDDQEYQLVRKRDLDIYEAIEKLRQRIC